MTPERYTIVKSPEIATKSIHQKKWTSSLQDVLGYELTKTLEDVIDSEIGHLFILEDLGNFPPYHKSQSQRAFINSSYQHASDIEIGYFDFIVSMIRLNKVRQLNLLLESVNETMFTGGYFLSYLETDKPPKLRADVVNFVHQSALSRVIQYISRLRSRISSFLDRSRKTISNVELHGRLVSCGFELVKVIQHKEKSYYLCKKVTPPVYNRNVSEGLLIRLNRLGKDGELIDFYKLRTMYPYSEFLQEYIYEKKGISTNGKFSHDPRVTPAGRILRKYFIDEVPMLWNLIRGDLKLVGIRPISQQYQGIYPTEFAKFRSRFKPGVIPPYYADLPKGFEEIVESEKRYLTSYESSPLATDVKYLVKSAYNIIFKRARSS